MGGQGKGLQLRRGWETIVGGNQAFLRKICILLAWDGGGCKWLLPDLASDYCDVFKDRVQRFGTDRVGTSTTKGKEICALLGLPSCEFWVIPGS